MRTLLITITLLLAQLSFGQRYISTYLSDKQDNFVKRAYYAQTDISKLNTVLLKEATKKLTSNDPREVEMALKILAISAQFETIKNLPEDFGISYTKHIVNHLKKALINGDTQFDLTLFKQIKKEDLWRIGNVKQWSHEASQSDMMMRILVAREVIANKESKQHTIKIPDDYLSNENKTLIKNSLKENPQFDFYDSSNQECNGIKDVFENHKNQNSVRLYLNVGIQSKKQTEIESKYFSKYNIKLISCGNGVQPPLTHCRSKYNELAIKYFDEKHGTSWLREFPTHLKIFLPAQKVNNYTVNELVALRLSNNSNSFNNNKIILKGDIISRFTNVEIPEECTPCIDRNTISKLNTTKFRKKNEYIFRNTIGGKISQRFIHDSCNSYSVSAIYSSKYAIPILIDKELGEAVNLNKRGGKYMIGYYKSNPLNWDVKVHFEDRFDYCNKTTYKGISLTLLDTKNNRKHLKKLNSK